jgi:hypothetical protein
VTLLEAVHSLGIVELAAVSWINIYPAPRGHIAAFTIALVLPFLDPALSDEFHQPVPRFWPDQHRLLNSPQPIGDQIREVQSSGVLGNVEAVRLIGHWLIETHAGSLEERSDWLASVIVMEGRSPRE